MDKEELIIRKTPNTVTDNRLFMIDILLFSGHRVVITVCWSCFELESYNSNQVAHDSAFYKVS